MTQEVRDRHQDEERDFIKAKQDREKSARFQKLRWASLTWQAKHPHKEGSKQ
jgi:hypothetical protein